jgi:hypothetical protein
MKLLRCYKQHESGRPPKHQINRTRTVGGVASPGRSRSVTRARGRRHPLRTSRRLNCTSCRPPHVLGKPDQSRARAALVACKAQRVGPEVP